MKKLLFIFAFLLIGCTTEELPQEDCNCVKVDYGTINSANPWRAEAGFYSNNCEDNGVVLYNGSEWQGGNFYEVITKVECN